MDSQTVLPTSSKKSFSWLFITFSLISLGMAGWFYYRNLQLKQQLTQTPNPSITASPQPSLSPKAITNQEPSWKTAKY